MAREKKTNSKRVTRYTYGEVKEPRMPETGHTALLPADEQVVSVPMDNGWSAALHVGKLPNNDIPVVVDMDPAADPTLFWAGKRNRRQVPVLPLQRNEVVSESRIAQIIERAQSAAAAKAPQMTFGSVFADLEKSIRESDKTKRIEFYSHDEGWKNKLICGDSLHVLESLLHYEQLRGEVQMVYIDPPYGIKYDSNFQQRVDSPNNDESNQADDVLVIKAFRDTWALGVHSYLSYLAERLYLCRELLADTGSVFVQISDTNVHLVRSLMDEVFGASNYISLISFAKTTSQSSDFLPTVGDYLIWYSRDRESAKRKHHQLYQLKSQGATGAEHYDWVELPDGVRRRMTTDEIDGTTELPPGSRFFTPDNFCSSRQARAHEIWPVEVDGREYWPTGASTWKTNKEGMELLRKAKRLIAVGNTLRYVRYLDDFSAYPLSNFWADTGVAGFAGSKDYAVQTNPKVVQRCIAMTTEPGDIVFDPTCGSGTTALCAEQLGRRWITCDTSRVALNVARRRLLAAVFPHYLTTNGKVSSGLQYETLKRTTMGTITGQKESATVQRVDKPLIDTSALRVTGPFEVMLLGRYSIEDWKGYVATSGGDAMSAAKLENYIEVICRLYRSNAAVQGASGFVHAIAEGDKEKIAISIGPLSGRVTAKQVNDVVQDAVSSGVLEVHVLGWAFEANVGEVKTQLEKRGKVKIELVMIRPDTLAEGLKVTKPETLFSPLALPDIEVSVTKNGKEQQTTVRLKGVAVFDRKHRTTDYKRADSGYVSAWYLDEDYDGDCFVDCQMFFDFKKAPNLNALGLSVEPEEFKFTAESQPFPARGYKRIAVKVVDVFGNESTVVRDL
jgi:adenine-specific DNA-methyltransferase